MTAIGPSVPWVAVVSLVAGVSLFGLAVYLEQHRGKPGATWFMAALCMQGLWCSAYAVALVVTDPTWRIALEVLSWIGLSWVGYLFLGFALDYTGRAQLRQSWLYRGLGLVPIAGTMMLLTNSYHSLLWRDAQLLRVLDVVALDYTFQFWGYAVLVIGMAYAGVGVFLMADAILSYGPLYRSEAFAVGLSTLPPTIGLLVWMFDIGPVSAVNWGVVLSVAHAGFDAYAFVGKNMFETSPVTRRVADEQAINVLPNPVLILDENYRLVDYNSAAASTFSELTPELIGETVSGSFQIDLTQQDEETQQYVTVSTGERTRQFTIRSAPLSDSRNTVVGYTVLFQDVTKEIEREQRLNVFNRVLRHNLRNKVNVVMGYATTIRDRSPEPDIQEFARRIEATSRDLNDVGEKARAFNQLRKTEPTFECVNLGQLLEEVTTAVGGRYESAMIETQIRERTEVITDPEFLHLALENLVENALEHTSDGSRRVWIGVSESPREEYVIAIQIHDEGPGIPDSEIEVIRQGSETTLEHGSGIGLWIVKWCLQVLGGTISFEQTETGTTVSVHLPERARSRQDEMRDSATNG